MEGKMIQLDPHVFALVPRKGGYAILEQRVIAAFYKELHSHSVDLYEFRFIPNDGGDVELIMGGGFEAKYAHTKNATKFVREHQDELKQAITDFSEANHRIVYRNNKTILQTENDQPIALIAAPSDRGIIVGGWYNSQCDTDVSTQMLAYIMFCFAALNRTDIMLKEHAYHTLPYDTRYGKFDANVARETALTAIAKIAEEVPMFGKSGRDNRWN